MIHKNSRRKLSGQRTFSPSKGFHYTVLSGEVEYRTWLVKWNTVRGCEVEYVADEGAVIESSLPIDAHLSDEDRLALHDVFPLRVIDLFEVSSTHMHVCVSTHPQYCILIDTHPPLRWGSTGDA